MSISTQFQPLREGGFVWVVQHTCTRRFPRRVDDKMDASGTAHISQLRLVQVLSGHEARIELVATLGVFFSGFAAC
jgi:hypothetical protein